MDADMSSRNSSPEPTGTLNYANVVAKCYDVSRPTKMMARLINIPHQRDLKLKRNSKGQWRTVIWTRPANCEAVLAYVTGDPTDDPCGRCRKGYGPFVGCVVSTVCGFGACSNCHYNSEGMGCSFREEQTDDGGLPKRVREPRGVRGDESWKPAGKKTKARKSNAPAQTQARSAKKQGTRSGAVATNHARPAPWTSSNVEVVLRSTVNSQRLLPEAESPEEEASPPPLLPRGRQIQQPPAPIQAAAVQLAPAPPAAPPLPFPTVVPAGMSYREKRAMARCLRDMANVFDQAADEDVARLDV